MGLLTPLAIHRLPDECFSDWEHWRAAAHGWFPGENELEKWNRLLSFLTRTGVLAEEGIEMEQASTAPVEHIGYYSSFYGIADAALSIIQANRSSKGFEGMYERNASVKLEEQLFMDWPRKLRLIEKGGETLGDGVSTNFPHLNFHDDLNTIAIMGLTSRALCEWPTNIKTARVLEDRAHFLQTIAKRLDSMLGRLYAKYTDARPALDALRDSETMVQKDHSHWMVINTARIVMEAKQVIDNHILIALVYIKKEYEGSTESDEDKYFYSLPIAYMMLPESSPRHADPPAGHGEVPEKEEEIQQWRWSWGTCHWSGTLELDVLQLPHIYPNPPVNAPQLDQHLNRGRGECAERDHALVTEQMFAQSPWWARKLRLMVIDHLQAGKVSEEEMADLFERCEQSLERFNPTLKTSAIMVDWKVIRELLSHELIKLGGLRAYIRDLIVVLRTSDGFGDRNGLSTALSDVFEI